MYTAEIGRILLDRWRDKHRQPNLTAKEFFDSYFFPLFFDDERYLMVANNSKFDQAYNNKKKTPLTKEIREQARLDFHKAVKELSAREGHVYMGGFAVKLEAPTASQITDLNINLTPEETYLTWFGMAAGIGIKGGVSILLKEPKILDQIVAGWEVYRSYMQSEPTLKPHQIDTWNGWWLYWCNDPDFRPEDPLRHLSADALEVKDGVAAFLTIPWSQLLFTLGRALEETEQVLGYVYSFGQTNTSIGFIPMLLGQINNLADIYLRLFGDNDRRKTKQFTTLYETNKGFITACRLGAIGLRALEPKDLRNYLNISGGRQKSLRLKSDSDHLNFQFFKTWIIAMLDNKTLIAKAKRFAADLNSVGGSDRGKRVLDNKVNAILEATGRRSFIQSTTDLIRHEEFVAKAEFDYGIFQEIVEDIVEMPATNIPLFLTLVRFEHAFLNLKKD